MATVWLIVVVGGPLLLFAAIFYGVFQYRNRDKRMDAASDASARRVRAELGEERREAEGTGQPSPTETISRRD